MTDDASQARARTGSAERVREFLTAHGLAEGIVSFSESTKTAQMAADAVGCELGQIVKTLVAVCRDDGRAVIALVAGDRRGDLGAMAEVAGCGKMRMANADEVRAATGYAIGGVSPFDLPEHLPVLIDDSLARFQTVYSAAGTPNSVVPLALSELTALSRGCLARVSQ